MAFWGFETEAKNHQYLRGPLDKTPETWENWYAHFQSETETDLDLSIYQNEDLGSHSIPNFTFF